jgi:hypothetical protein
MPMNSEVTRDKTACVTSDLTSCLPHFKVSGSHTSVDDKLFCDMTSYQMVGRVVVLERLAAIREV